MFQIFGGKNHQPHNLRKTVLFSGLTLTLGLSLFANTFIFAKNTPAQPATYDNSSEFVYAQSVEFTSGTNLKQAWQTVDKLGKDLDLNSLQFTSSFSTDKLSLPIVFTGNNLVQATKNFNLIKSSTITSLVTSKKDEAKFLNQNTTVEYASFTPLIDQANVLANINLKIPVLNLQVDQSAEKILVSKITFTTNNPLTSLDQLAKDSKLKVDSSEPKKAKVSLNTSNPIKTVKKSKVYNDYKAKVDNINQKIQREASKLDKSKPVTKNQVVNNDPNKPIVTVDGEVFTDLNLPTVGQSLEKIDTTTNTVNPDLSDNFEIIDGKSTKSSVSLPTGQITKLTQIKQNNPLYISKEKQIENQKQIEAEKQQAKDHNSKFAQTYTDAEKVSMGQTSSQNNQNNPLAWLFGSIPAQANGLSNPNDSLLIYSRTNTGLTIDLKYGDMGNGSQFTLYNRTGTWNQRFAFHNGTNEIKMNGKCLDVYGGNYSNYGRVGIWDCNGSWAQKWVVFSDFSIRPRYALERGINVCLDAKNGITNGSLLHLWSCLGINDQNWRVGDNDFNSTNYQLKINAIANGNISGSLSGHVFVSIYKNGSQTNTFSAWLNGGNDYDGNNTGGRSNNIAEGDGIHVDNPNDWNWGQNPSASGFRTRTASLPKTHYDYIKYGSGYRKGYVNGTANYNLITLTCANESSNLWNLAVDNGMVASKVPYTNLPKQIYDAI